LSKAIEVDVGSDEPTHERRTWCEGGDTPRVPSYFRDANAPTPNQPRRIGVVAFVERDDRILLERRADFGTWGLIGGLLEEDETVAEGIAREVREETGLETVATELFGVFSDPSRIVAYPDGNVVRLLSVAFTVQVAGGEARPSPESLELRWVPVAELGGMEIGPAQTPLVGAYLSRPGRPVVA
jgi:ADP-ribose pyrophosphatase YjhB (NUDIX family)